AFADAAAARTAATQAEAEAQRARTAATDAENQAAAADSAATLAEKEAATAQGAAQQAEKDAADAAKLAKSAEEHATSAETAAKNAGTYAKEADEAAKRAEEYQREQERKAREEAAREKEIDEGARLELGDLERKALAEAGISVEEYEAARALAEQNLLDYLLENGAELLVEFAAEDIKKCIDDPDIPTCLWAIVQNLPWAKAVKLVSKLPKIGKVIWGIGEFLDKSAKAKKLVTKAEKVIEDAYKKLPSCLTGGKPKPKSASRASLPSGQGAVRSAALASGSGSGAARPSSTPGDDCAIPDNATLDATWEKLTIKFGTRNEFGIWAWGGNSKGAALDLRTADHVAKLKKAGFTRQDAVLWKIFYEHIHNKAVARHPNNPEKVNPSAQHRAKLFEYIIENIGE
ncbi:hypothetical protein AB0M39_32265, partial [Streptomyces sp. NPDC051907]